MAMGSSPMVPQKAEQSQLLVQQPDAPSPAQPQVLNVKYKFLTVTCFFFFHPYKICFKLGLKMITSKSSKLSLLYITSLVLVNRKLGIFLLCRDDSGVCWLKWNCDSYFPFLVFFPLISSVCVFPSDLYPASPSRYLQHSLQVGVDGGRQTMTPTNEGSVSSRGTGRQHPVADRNANCGSAP